MPTSETFCRMIREHQVRLTRLCYAILHDQALAEDAVQETFLKAWRNAASFRGDASERTWLSRIAVNVCRDMRRSAWFRFTDRRMTPDMLPEPADEPRASDADRELTAAVMSLPLRLREAVLLYYFQELTTPEIATTLGVSHQAVSDRLARARRKLRAALERSLPE